MGDQGVAGLNWLGQVLSIDGAPNHLGKDRHIGKVSSQACCSVKQLLQGASGQACFRQRGFDETGNYRRFWKIAKGKLVQANISGASQATVFPADSDRE
jgi:hypothetical protein